MHKPDTIRYAIFQFSETNTIVPDILLRQNILTHQVYIASKIPFHQHDNRFKHLESLKNCVALLNRVILAWTNEVKSS